MIEMEYNPLNKIRCHESLLIWINEWMSKKEGKDFTYNRMLNKKYGRNYRVRYH